MTIDNERARRGLLKRAGEWESSAEYQTRIGDDAWRARRHSEAVMYYQNAKEARQEAAYLRDLAEKRTNAGNPRNPRYLAQLHSGCQIVARLYFYRLTDARQWAESFGTTADSLVVSRPRSGTVVAVYRRDRNGDGSRWFKAAT